MPVTDEVKIALAITAIFVLGFGGGALVMLSVAHLRRRDGPPT